MRSHRPFRTSPAPVLGLHKPPLSLELPFPGAHVRGVVWLGQACLPGPSASWSAQPFSSLWPDSGWWYGQTGFLSPCVRGGQLGLCCVLVVTGDAAVSLRAQVSTWTSLHCSWACAQVSSLGVGPTVAQRGRPCDIPPAVDKGSSLSTFSRPLVPLFTFQSEVKVPCALIAFED